jgi:two-component system NtrC family sensor kinase
MRFDFPFRTRSLKAKLILSYLVILGIGGLVTSIVGSYIVSSTIMMQAQRTAEHDLATARTVFDQELGTLRQAVWLLAGRLANGAVQSPPRGTALAALAGVRADLGLDFLALADARGRVTYRVVSPDSVGDDVSALLSIRSALEGRPAAAVELVPAHLLAREDAALAARARTRLVPTPKATPTDRTEQVDGLVLLAAAPLRDAAGAVRGVLYGGVLLNQRFEMVDRVWSLLYRGERYRREDVGSVTIFQRDVRIATTVRNGSGDRAVGTRVSAAVAEAVLDRGEPWRDRAYVVNDWYIAAYDPLRDLAGHVVGILYVGVLEQAYASIRDRVILSFFALATVGFIMIIGLTYAMISNITRPIGEMVAATRSITAGRFDQEVRSTAQGEVTLLAESFNTMLASLRQMKADLEEWGNTLERKVHERTEQLMRMQVRVAQSERLASLGMLAAGVAHEINNPLGGILSLTALTLEDLPADHPDHHNLEVVVRQTERCRDIVKGLLDFSRQSAATMEDEDVNDILAQTLALVSKQAVFLNVEVVQHWAPDLPHVTADRQQLQQVFLNLLVNAVQAMGEHGTITITTRPADDGAAAEVVITDSGCGIPPDLIDRIFDPFFTTKPGGTGTGLGLAIAYGIVTRHHGTISVESEVGKGTTFIIRLPAAAPVPAVG